jgi:hypothetical protein
VIDQNGKENIFWARLDGAGFTVISDGHQHVRTWVVGDRVRMLVAYHSELQ